MTFTQAPTQSYRSAIQAFLTLLFEFEALNPVSLYKTKGSILHHPRFQKVILFFALPSIQTAITQLLATDKADLVVPQLSKYIDLIQA